MPPPGGGGHMPPPGGGGHMPPPGGGGHMPPPRGGGLMSGLGSNYFRPPVRQAPGGYVTPTGGNLIDDFVDVTGTFRRIRTTSAIRLKQKGKKGATFLAAKVFISSSFRRNLYDAKMASYQQLHSEGRLTEKAYTDLRIKETAKFHKRYLKMGYYTQEEYDGIMAQFCASVGRVYEPETDEKEKGRSK